MLYEDLKLPSPVKYGKGKTTSTAADILEALAADHEIARLVLEYRQLAKLKGTYVDALPALIDADTGPSPHDFQPDRRRDGPAVLVESESAEHSDSNGARPRDPCGIRAARGLGAGGRRLFADRASPAGAHVEGSGAGERVPQRRGHSHAHRGRGVRDASADGYRRDAAQCESGKFRHRLRPDAVRAWLHSSASTAKKPRSISGNYFERYSGVKKFIDATIEEVRKTGRREDAARAGTADSGYERRNPNARSFAERTAVNTPLQGTAADLIKMAMIRIDRELTRRSSEAKMLLAGP